MSHVCFYFQVHQPYRLRDMRITEIGTNHAGYFDDEKNEQIFRKVAEKCYLPANSVIFELLRKYPDFNVAYSLSGVFLDQCEQYGPDVLESFKALAKTGKVEFLAETYYHSLSAIRSTQEFCEQVQKHVKKIEELFGQTPKVFRNTELIFSNEIAHTARLMGFEGILAEGADHLLQGRSPNMPYIPPAFRMPRAMERTIAKYRPKNRRSDSMHILLKNYQLSDDIAFRFSNTGWASYPLNAETFSEWIGIAQGESVNLFMDYETFGEHQWADTGIFEFLSTLPKIWAEKGIKARTPSELIADWKKQKHEEQMLDAHTYVSWADTERDLSAWLSNDIQHAALSAIYELEDAVKNIGDTELLNTWRKLQTSDHFYYMCTKFWHDGDVHKYFSPYDSPYEAYRRFSHVIEDLRMRLKLTPNT